MDDEKIMEIAEPFLKPVGNHWCFENAIRDNGDIEDFAKALLAAKDQRIAELEAELADEREYIKTSDFCPRCGVSFGCSAVCVDKMERLQAERVSDELLKGLCDSLKAMVDKHQERSDEWVYCLMSIERVESILDLRRKNREADYEDDTTDELFYLLRQLGDI